MLHRIVMAIREWLHRLYGSFRLRSNDAAFRAEMAHHLALAEQRFLDRGHSPAEAVRLARLSCGHPDNTLERLRAQRGIPWFGVFTLDVKLGLRMLRKYLGVTLIGGLALTVGFGILIAVFVYFDVVMWNDTIPLDEGERVVAIQVWDPEDNRRSEITIDDFERWEGLRSLEDVGAFRTVERGIVHPDGETELVQVAEITATGFRLARTAPAIGRMLLGEDESASAEPVIVIGYDEWQSRFAGDAGVVGRTLRLGDRVHTIVGVMPEGFGFPINHQFWIPWQPSRPDFISAPPAGTVFARLAERVTLDEAQAELSAAGLLPSESPSQRSNPPRPTVVQYATNFIDDTDPNDLARRGWTARMVMLLVSLLLIPPCANIAMLVYARTVTRREEIAMRTALGASRGRIVLQLFIEMLVLSTLAVCLALIGAAFVFDTVERLMLEELGRPPFWIEFGISTGALLFAGSLAVMAALVTGLVPALGATKHYGRPGLNALDLRNRMRLGPVWTVLIVVQIAFTFAALPSAVELGWGVLRSSVLGPGFAAEEFLTARLDYDADGTDEAFRSSTDAQARFESARRQLIERIEADPRVQSQATLASAVPGEGQWLRFFLDDHAEAVSETASLTARIGVPLARTIDIDDRYLDVFDIEVITGRGFQPGDYGSSAQPVLVNATFAQEVFPGGNPLGRRISYFEPDQARIAGEGSDVRSYEIVGVIADRPAHPYRGSVFRPMEPGYADPVSIAFRARTTEGSLREALQDLAEGIDPSLDVAAVRTLKEIYDEQAAGNYLGGVVLIAVAIAVLALAAAGTYALMTFTVNQRRREIAIRLALGARPGKLLGDIFRNALRQVSLGAALGVLLALFVQVQVSAREMGGLEVPGVIPSAIALLVLIGLGASYGPARRALGTDPTESIRD